MVRSKRSRFAAKRVVYLWGAGATQAEISHLGGTVNLLMRDSDRLGPGVATRIIDQLPRTSRARFTTDKGLDIEKLITLLAATNVNVYSRLAETIRRHYFEDIRDNLAQAKVLDAPKLAIALLRLHEMPEFKRIEELRGIISTNHDGLLQRAASAVHPGIDIGFDFASPEIQCRPGPCAPLLQLHGSFTWRFGLPIQVASLSESSQYSRDTVWIPPTIAKESKNYPFNKLAGRAYELLARECDVLRVVGSSLTQNDWNILAMLFSAQRHNELKRGAPFNIELIMPHSAGVGVVQECSFLRNLAPIGFLSEGDLSGYKENTLTDEMHNPFFFWLKEKIRYHVRKSEILTAGLHADVAEIAGDPA